MAAAATFGRVTDRFRMRRRMEDEGEREGAKGGEGNRMRHNGLGSQADRQADNRGRSGSG